MPPPEPTFPRPYHRPQVPTPYDSVDQVHGFLAEFLYALDYKHDREAANTDATKLHTDGRGLYEVPREEWLAQYGIKGLTIYNHLQRSKYGVVSSTAYILSPYCFDSFLTLSHLFLFNSYLKLKKGAFGRQLSWLGSFFLFSDWQQESNKLLPTKHLVETHSSLSLQQQPSQSIFSSTFSAASSSSNLEPSQSASRDDPQGLRRRQLHGGYNTIN